MEHDIKIDMSAHEDVTFSMKDVTRMLGEDAHTIRFWEKTFHLAITRKESKGKALHPRRLFTRSDVTLLKKIQRLVRKDGDGLSLKNAHYQLVEEGVLPSETLIEYAAESSSEPSSSAAKAKMGIQPEARSAGDGLPFMEKQAAARDGGLPGESASAKNPKESASATAVVPVERTALPGVPPAAQAPLKAAFNVSGSGGRLSPDMFVAAEALSHENARALVRKVCGELSAVIALLRSPA